jgi:hypothetical protein
MVSGDVQAVICRKWPEGSQVQERFHTDRDRDVKNYGSGIPNSCWRAEHAKDVVAPESAHAPDVRNSKCALARRQDEERFLPSETIAVHGWFAAQATQETAN